MIKLKDWLGTNAFLGSGWSFPPRTDGRGRKDVLLRAGHRGKSAHPLQHLARRTGESLRLRLPLRRYVFEPLITLEDVSFEEQPQEGLLLIHLTYTVVRTNNRNNMVYPFYLNEGTNV